MTANSMLVKLGHGSHMQIQKKYLPAVVNNEPINGYILSWPTEIKCVVVRKSRVAICSNSGIEGEHDTCLLCMILKVRYPAISCSYRLL